MMSNTFRLLLPMKHMCNHMQVSDAKTNVSQKKQGRALYLRFEREQKNEKIERGERLLFFYPHTR